MCYVISVAYFADNQRVMEAVLQSDEIRRRTLERCLAIPGYRELSLEEKNKIYDRIREEVCQELYDRLSS